jgi:predicted acetyltransferase
MNLAVRAVDADELGSFARTEASGFGEDMRDWFDKERAWMSLALDRTAAVFDGNEIVATSRNYPFELTLPGGAAISVAGVSAVAVLPTHRRRGLLRSMMGQLLDDTVAHHEPVSILTASEGGIYERFGYGISTRTYSVRIDPRDLAWANPRPSGSTRLVGEDEALRIECEVFDRMRRAHPGAVSRPDEWWCHQYDKVIGTRFDVVYEGESGTVDGYVTYGIRADWGVHGPAHRLRVLDFVACTDDAVHALWRYLGEVDLVATVESRSLPLDSPLPWLLQSARAVKVEMLHDDLWTRLLDLPAALGARRYPVAGGLVLQVHDVSRPGTGADGVFALEGGPDGASVERVAAAADIECDVSAVSAAWLGGVRWSELAAAGRVVEHRSGALAAADAMFASSPLPHACTWF